MEVFLARVSPVDLYFVRISGMHGEVSRLPFVAGHDGVGLVRKVIGACCSMSQCTVVRQSRGLVRVKMVRLTRG